jgi:hypothetical protein
VKKELQEWCFPTKIDALKPLEAILKRLSKRALLPVFDW